MTLENHPIWEAFNQILTQMDTKTLVMEHLKGCHYKLKGYWNGEEFYEELTFVNPLRAELVNSALGQIHRGDCSDRFLQLRFVLKPEIDSTGEDDEIGELTLVLNVNQEIVDENWLIDVESPFVMAKKP